MYMSVGNSHLWSFVCPFWLVPVCVQAFSTIVNVSRRETESEAEMCAGVYLVGHMQLVLYAATATGGAIAPCVWRAADDPQKDPVHSALSMLRGTEQLVLQPTPTVRHSPPTAPLNPPAVSIQPRAMTLDWKRSLGASAWSFPWSTKSEFLLLQHTAKHNLLFLVNVTCIYTTNPCFMS